MKEYCHTQIGYTILAFLGFAIVCIATVTASKTPHDDASFAIVILFIVTALFSTLTIKIKKRTIHWYFGPYFWKKKIKLSEVVRAEIVQNQWWYGWGIRHTKFGWLYNVSGLCAIQLELKSGKKIRLGTNEPTKLKEAIDGVIQKNT